MTTFAAICALIVEIMKFIRQSGGPKTALAALKEVNEAVDAVKAAQTAQEGQDAAEKISNAISGD